MANSRPLPDQDPVPDANLEQVWLTAGEAADTANVTHSQIAAWVAVSKLSSRMGWRGGAEIQLVLLSDLESLAERIDLDRVRGSLAERGVFTGPRRVVLGGFKDGPSPTGTGSGPEVGGQEGSKVVIRAAHEIRAEDRVWASELDGEVRRLRQVVRTLRDDHESLERHLDRQPALTQAASSGSESLPASSARAKRPIDGDLASTSRGSRSFYSRSTGVSSGAMIAITCGVVLGMIGASIVFPGAKTMASEKAGLPETLVGSPSARLELAPEAEALHTSQAESELAILALDAMEQDVAPALSEWSTVVPAVFGGEFTDPLGASQQNPSGAFFASFLHGDRSTLPTGVTGTSDAKSARVAIEASIMGPRLAPDLRAEVAPRRLTGPAGDESRTRIHPDSNVVQPAQDMLVELPPQKPRAHGVKPNSTSAPQRLRVPMALAELDRTLFARRSALLSDCAYTKLVAAAQSGDNLQGALVLGPCFGPTREGQSGSVAAPGTHRVGRVACCRHHAFVERMTGAAGDENARLGLQTEAKAAMGEGVLPPLFRLRANRSASRFVREETRGWTSAGLDGAAGTTQSEAVHHEWKLSETQPKDGSIRVELTSWIQPVIPFDAAKFRSPKASLKSEDGSMKHFHMQLLVQAAPDGDVLEGFEWLDD